MGYVLMLTGMVARTPSTGKKLTNFMPRALDYRLLDPHAQTWTCKSISELMTVIYWLTRQQIIYSVQSYINLFS